MAVRFALSNHFSPGHKIVLVAWGTCAISLCFFWRTESKLCHFGVDLPSLAVYLETHIFASCIDKSVLFPFPPPPFILLFSVTIFLGSGWKAPVVKLIAA